MIAFVEFPGGKLFKRLMLRVDDITGVAQGREDGASYFQTGTCGVVAVGLPYEDVLAAWADAWYWSNDPMFDYGALVGSRGVIQRDVVPKPAWLTNMRGVYSQHCGGVMLRLQATEVTP